jgi:hypothetical protein
VSGASADGGRIESFVDHETLDLSGLRGHVELVVYNHTPPPG